MRRKRAIVAVGLVVVGAGLALVGNPATSGSGWWAWLAFGALLAASGALVWWQETHRGSSRPSTELLTEAKGGVVVDSPIDTPVSGDVKMTIRARKRGRVIRSGHTGRR